jgi:DNA-binding transcriptional regulator YiaG
MTHTEFRAALKSLGLRQSWLAGALGVSPNTVYRWAKGDMAVPQYAVLALSLIQQNEELRGRRHSTPVGV